MFIFFSFVFSMICSISLFNILNSYGSDFKYWLKCSTISNGISVVLNVCLFKPLYTYVCDNKSDGSSLYFSSSLDKIYWSVIYHLLDIFCIYLFEFSIEFFIVFINELYFCLTCWSIIRKLFNLCSKLRTNCSKSSIG